MEAAVTLGGPTPASTLGWSVSNTVTAVTCMAQGSAAIRSFL